MAKKVRKSVKHRIKNISLRLKVPLIVCMILVILVGSTSLFLYRYYYKMFSNTVKKTIESTVRLNVNEIANLNDTIFSVIEMVNNNETAYLLPSGGRNFSNIAAQIIEYEKKEDQSNLAETITLLNMNKKMFTNTFTIALHLTRRESHAALLVPSAYPITHLLGVWSKIGDTGILKSSKAESCFWYQKAEELAGENYWFCEEEYPEKIFLTKQLNYRCLDEENEYSVRPLGVFIMEIDMQWIEARIQKEELTQGSQIYLTDQQGEILYAAGEQQLSQREVSDYMGQEEMELQYNKFHDTQYLVKKNDLGYGLYMLTAVPIYDIEQMAAQMVRVILVVMMLVLLFGIIFMVLFSRWLVNPIVKLSKQMQKGVIEYVDADYYGEDEIGLLYQRYNSMQSKIQTLMKKNWERAEKQKNAEIHALQMQINPHFVFNTLSSVSSLALITGQDEIAKQLNLLSDIMRYNTRNPDALVSLAMEISMIRQYEEIQRFSFDDCFHFYYEIAEDCEDILIPKLIIQPLVENAIIHSRNRDGKGSVLISARRSDTKLLVIKVTDDGQEADVEQINRYLRGEVTLDSDKESFGIRNVYERLRLVYNEKGTLEYGRTKDGRTEATITIQ